MKTFSKIAIVLILWAVIPFGAATLATAMTQCHPAQPEGPGRQAGGRRRHTASRTATTPFSTTAKPRQHPLAANPQPLKATMPNTNSKSKQITITPGERRRAEHGRGPADGPAQ